MALDHADSLKHPCLLRKQGRVPSLILHSLRRQAPERA
ncbi:hypothetical protein AcetOrient_orf01742 [Acetobacter orientalis]|uniref:Uncharacterized protein n=1 Tax=Acetobacter orientalis TaxID=146474 RepID=A0A2Z5ZGM6_9PROT|nr:hypothetical protein AcetOrient_orf01742 [Acetobacter orientalis]